MQCFENFGGANAPNAPPGCGPALHYQNSLSPCITCVHLHAAKRKVITWRFVAMLLLRNKVQQ